MSIPSILVANGPNLGALGERQPEIYGHRGMRDLPDMVTNLLGADTFLTLEFFQSNHEGALIDRLEQARQQGTSGIVLNAGALTHTSLALADCLAWIKVPTVEVHISNVLAREEPIRQKSFIGRHVIGVIAGFGIASYALAIQALMLHFHTQK
ncbi:MAG: type II 3-dehydroquinate dehydratase [Desulfovibrionaceae bacterium]